MAQKFYSTMNMKEKVMIKVAHTERKYLAELFGVSYPTVRKALNGNTTTDQQRRIRKAAIERGGIEFTSLKK